MSTYVLVHGVRHGTRERDHVGALMRETVTRSLLRHRRTPDVPAADRATGLPALTLDRLIDRSGDHI